MKKIKKLIFHPLFSGSAIMFIGSNSVNAINYLYHLIMGRLLGPSLYGELVALISLIGLVGIVPSSFQLVIVKFISGSKNKAETQNLLTWFNRKSIILGLVIFLTVILGSNLISNFLKIKIELIILVGFMFIFNLPSLVYRSALQGLLLFKEISIASNIEGITKFAVGVALVLLGFSVLGATIGFLVSIILGMFYARSSISSYLNNKNEKVPNVSGIAKYYPPVLFQTIATTSLFSIDLVLVKHFFSSTDAGLYASLSTLGRIILFASGPIVGVMFPLVSQRYAKGQNYLSVFGLSFVLTSLIGFSVVLTYLFFPELAIKLLFGTLYLKTANLLVYFAIFISLINLSTLIITFYLSINHKKIVIIPLIAAVLQIVGIYLIHDSLFSVIMVSIVVAILLLICLLSYFFYISIVNKKKDIFSNSPGN